LLTLTEPYSEAAQKMREKIAATNKTYTKAKPAISRGGKKTLYADTEIHHCIRPQGAERKARTWGKKQEN